tara:strand:- start:3087 stop:4799 length:1713 start_codon:yes stop_codon:yes gene_type:complete
MGAAEREGWTTWNRYKEAGVVEETLAFTDEPVITSHALGKTSELLGKCWPIDAAVAYTLASHGPNAQLTWEDMVNQNTRIASVMMSGKVGWSRRGVPNPQITSCGHDHVNTMIHHIPNVTMNSMDALVVDMDAYLEEADWYKSLLSMPGAVSTEVRNLLEFRDDKTLAFWEIIFTERFKPLKEFLEEYWGTTKWYWGTTKGGDMTPMSYEDTKGECAWADDPEKQCSYHDGVLYKGWVLVHHEESTSEKPVYETFWRRGQGRTTRNGWNHDHLENEIGWNYSHTLSASRVVVFDRVKRSLAQSIPDDQVIEHIKGSIARMRKWDGRCLVHKEGRGKTSRHRWSDWGWLEEMATWVQDTQSKNRKEDETQCSTCYAAGIEDEEGNSFCECGAGWRYVKYDSRQSYGHEIAKFEWRPMEQPKAYTLKIGQGYSSKTLPYRFKTGEQAVTFRTFLNQMVNKIGGVHRERTIDMTTGQDVPPEKGVYKVVYLGTDLTMKWDKDPEMLPTPQQALDAVIFGSVQESKTAMENLKCCEVGGHKIPKQKLINEPEEPAPPEEQEQQGGLFSGFGDGE